MMTPYLYPIALKKGIIRGEVLSIKLIEAPTWLTNGI